MPESEVHLFSVENFWHPHEIGIFVTDRLVTIVCEGGRWYRRDSYIKKTDM